MEKAIEWPATRRHRQSPHGYQSEESFDLLGSLSDMNARLDFQSIVQSLIRGYETAVPPEQALPELSTLAGRVAVNANENRDGLFLALACIEFLQKSPDTKRWSYLWSLTWHDAALERNLPRAAVFVAKQDDSFKSQLLNLASELVDNAVKNPDLRSFTREKTHFTDARDHWLQNPTLIKIWWGLREGRSIEFRADEGAFGIVATLDQRAFIALLDRFDNPYPIQSALHDAGAEYNFAIWKALMPLAPRAFDDEGRWTGSFVAPILLYIAREKVLEAQNWLRADAPAQEVKDTASEIDGVTDAVSEAIGLRDDAGPCAERWTAWLMRQSLGGLSNEPVPYPVDARSRGYSDQCLITALGKTLAQHDWQQTPAPDAEPWEHWSYRCVLITLALSAIVPMPDAEAFLGQWQLTPEEWAAVPGQLLRERASIFETFGKRADAYGTRLLSLPLVETIDPHEAWTRLWDCTQNIREVVEFHDLSEASDHGLSTEREAAGLMRLIFGLGLMMLDFLVDPSRKIVGDRQALLQSIFADLTAAVSEMSMIDRLDMGYWNDARRHLAIRRAIWSEDVAAKTLATTFRSTANPTFADFVTGLSADTEGLLALIEVAGRNNVQPLMIRSALNEAGIDLVSQIAFAEHLIQLSQKRAGVSEVQITAARSLLQVKMPFVT